MTPLYVGLAVVVAACGDGGAPCMLDSDCELGSVCEDGRCTRGCDETGDCPRGAVCAQRRCVEPRDAGPARADASQGSRDGGVDPPPCAEGETRCSSSVLQRCTAGLFRQAETCAYGCADGACRERCTANARRCLDDRVQTCGPLGLWYDSQQCPHACLDGACAGQCASGALRCRGAAVQLCSGGGEWQDAARCPFGCADGVCSGECVPGDRRCSQSRSELCDARGQWSSASECASPHEICDAAAGACVARLVSAGEYGVDSTEVTARQYGQFLESSAFRTVEQHALCEDNTAFSVYSDGDCEGHVFDPGAAPDLPVVCIDWCDAHAYCRWAGKRLCGAVGGGSVPPDFTSLRTLSQWHLACSGGNSRIYPYGAQHEPGRCNDASTGLRPVGSSAGCEGATAGIYDMAGNASEFEDAYSFGEPGSYWFRLRGGDYGSGERTTCWSTVTTTSRGRWWAQPDTGFRCCSP